MGAVQIFLGAVGRIFISLIFILAGLQHILNWQGSITELTAAIQSFALHLSPSHNFLHAILNYSLAHVPLLMGTAVIFMLLGGLLVFFGIKTRFGAFLLFLFIIPTTLLLHAFWNLQGDTKGLQIVMFLKNLSILGALLYLMVNGNGRPLLKKSAKKPIGEHK